MAKLRIPPYMQNKGLADISKDGLAVDTTDSRLMAAGSDDTIGEDVLVPPAPFGAGSGESLGGAPPTEETKTKMGGQKVKAGM